MSTISEPECNAIRIATNAPRTPLLLGMLLGTPPAGAAALRRGLLLGAAALRAALAALLACRNNTNKNKNKTHK